MLVDADAVEADLVGELQRVEVIVVGVVTNDRIEELGGGQVDPHAVVALPEVVGQVGIGHQVKEVELHARLLTLVIAASTCSSASARSMWPAPGMTSLVAFGISLTKSSTYCTGTNRSSAPCTMSVGARTRRSRRAKPRSGIGHRKRATVVMARVSAITFSTSGLPSPVPGARDAVAYSSLDISAAGSVPT